MSLPLRVVIVGAGVGGLATAYGLAYSKHADKFHVQVLDHREPFKGDTAQRPQGYPIRLSKPGRKALSSLLTPFDASLLSDAHAKLPLSHDGIAITHDSGRTAFAGRFAPFGKSSMVERGDLMRVLRDALEGRGVEVEYGRKVLGVQDDGEKWFAIQRGWRRLKGVGGGKGGRAEEAGVVKVMTDRGEVECDFVIGADGMHSAIRQSLHPHAQARALRKVARNYRLSSPDIWAHMADKEGINVILSGETGLNWTATLIPTKVYKGNGDAGEVYCVFTTGQEVGEGLEGCLGGFVEVLRRDPGFKAGVEDVTKDATRAGGVCPVDGQQGQQGVAEDLSQYQAKNHQGAKTRNVSISIQSVVSTGTDASTRPLIGSATSNETVEDEPTSLIEALRASQNPSTPTPTSVTWAAARGFSVIPEDAAESETNTMVDPVEHSDAICAGQGYEQVSTQMPEQEHKRMQVLEEPVPSVYTASLYTCNKRFSGTPHIALIGDAAHGMTPFAGTGASLALRDAEDLVRVLERRVDMIEQTEQAEQAKKEERDEKAVKGLFGQISGTVGKRKGRTPHRMVLPADRADWAKKNTDVVPKHPRHEAKEGKGKRVSDRHDLFDGLAPPAQATPTSKRTSRDSNKTRTKKQTEKAIRKDMYLFNLRMKRHADPAILASRGSLWLAMGESRLARGTREVVFGLGRALRVGRVSEDAVVGR